jgi:hypothetical protein
MAAHAGAGRPGLTMPRHLQLLDHRLASCGIRGGSASRPRSIQSRTGLIVGPITAVLAVLKQKSSSSTNGTANGRSFAPQDRQQALFDSERDRQLADMRRRMTDLLYERSDPKVPGI